MQETEETWVWSLGREDALEKGMATHSSILAWEIPWTEEPSGLQLMGVPKEWDMTEQLSIAWSLSRYKSHCAWRRKWQPTPVFLPGKFHGWRSLVSYSPWGGKESDRTEPLHFTSPHIGLPRWLSSKESTCQCGRHGVQCLGQEDDPGEGNGNPFQYSGLGNPMDREAWWGTVHWITKSQTWLSDWAWAHITSPFNVTNLHVAMLW